MPYRRNRLEGWLSVGACRGLAALLIIGAAVARILYLIWDCPLDLAQDEAHYWDWARNLDWSYYSKGPLVAWLIRASCELFGPLSVELSGTLMPAIRFPAVLCGSLLLASIYILTVQVFSSDRLALAIVVAGLLFPITTAGSTLITIDSPYTCCWGWALVLVHRAIFSSGVSGESSPATPAGWAWPLAGLVVGIGILAKYTMVIFLPSVGLFLLATPAYRRLLLRPGFWVMCVVAGLCCTPILVWNIQNDWVTFRHVHALSGGQARSLSWAGPFIYVGGQAAVLLIIWFAFWVCAMVAHRPWARGEEGVSQSTAYGQQYLWWLSAPMFLLFLAFSPRTEGGEINWPVTAYISGMVLAAGWLARQLSSPRTWWRRWVAANLALALLLGGGLTVVAHHTEWFHAPLARLAGEPSESNRTPLRKVDPTTRLRGWRTLAARVDEVRAELRAEGVEPVLACDNWSLPGELGVYCEGHPVVYSFGSAVGHRHSQYDLWHSPLSAPEDFKGRTFIFVGGLHPVMWQAFEQITPLEGAFHYEQGRLLSLWQISVCRGFKGFPRTGQTGY